MPVAPAIPIIDPTVRCLCVRPYPRHKRGCPNFNKKNGCPPNTKLYSHVYDLNRLVLAVWNVFDLKAHVDKMRKKHLSWTYAQLTNCLYWQGHERKLLRQQVNKVLQDNPGMSAEYCPEAMGVDITHTMANIGVMLEWPPTNIAIQVALLAYPKGGKDENYC